MFKYSPALALSSFIFIRSDFKMAIVQFCTTHTIEIWNIRSINQGKLEIIKPEMETLNIAVLGDSKLKWTGMGHF